MDKCTRYIDSGIVDIRISDRNELKFLYNLCCRSKIEAINIFLDSNNVFIAGESYLNGLVFFYTLNAGINNIILSDGKDKVSVSINNEPSQSQINNIDIFLDNISNKTYIRLGVTTNFLQALSLYGEKNVSLHIQDREVILISGSTKLSFGRVRIVADLRDYLTLVQGITWDKLNVNGVTDIAKALLKTKDYVYKRYIALEDDIIYSHNSTFLIELKSERVKEKYILPYTTIDIIKTIPLKAETFIGKKEDNIYVSFREMYLSWNIGKEFNDISNLLSMLKREEFMKVAAINKNEWGKFELLKTYAEVDSDSDVDVYISNNLFCLNKGENRAIVNAKVIDGQISFAVGVNTLMLAKTLCGGNPTIYLDKKGLENVLILYGNKLVAISIDKLKIDKLPHNIHLLGNAIRANSNYKKSTEPTQSLKIDMEIKNNQLDNINEWKNNFWDSNDNFICDISTDVLSWDQDGVINK